MLLENHSGAGLLAPLYLIGADAETLDLNVRLQAKLEWLEGHEHELYENGVVR